jgi:hypothetical protein
MCYFTSEVSVRIFMIMSYFTSDVSVRIVIIDNELLHFRSLYAYCYVR